MQYCTVSSRTPATTPATSAAGAAGVAKPTTGKESQAGVHGVHLDPTGAQRPATPLPPAAPVPVPAYFEELRGRESGSVARVGAGIPAPADGSAVTVAPVTPASLLQRMVGVLQASNPPTPESPEEAVYWVGSLLSHLLDSAIGASLGGAHSQSPGSTPLPGMVAVAVPTLTLLDIPGMLEVDCGSHPPTACAPTPTHLFPPTSCCNTSPAYAALLCTVLELLTSTVNNYPPGVTASTPGVGVDPGQCRPSLFPLVIQRYYGLYRAIYQYIQLYCLSYHSPSPGAGAGRVHGSHLKPLKLLTNTGFQHHPHLYKIYSTLQNNVLSILQRHTDVLHLNRSMGSNDSVYRACFSEEEWVFMYAATATSRAAGAPVV